MTRLSRAAIAVLVCLGLQPAVMAIGFRGGGGGGGGLRGGGGGFSGGGMSRPAVRPSMPNLGGGLPNMNRPAIPQARPSFPQQIPGGFRPSFTPPTANRPNIPSGGLKPSTRPNFTPPNVNTRPGVQTRPSLPTTRPGTQLPGVATKPAPRPGSSLPNLGGNRPSTNLPGRPSTLPGGRPSLGGGDRPTTLPGTRPGATTRPTPGDVGDFLGMQRPITRPETLPGNIGANRPGLTRPGVDATRPGLGNKLPGVGGATRPGIADNRFDFGNRPDWITRPSISRPAISQRPGWVNIGNDVNLNIHNKWNNTFVKPANYAWWNRPPNRINYWRGWGDGVRHHWSHHHHCHNWFTGSWWGGHPHALCPWHYHWNWGLYRPSYWWRVPVWASLTNWFIWSSAPPPCWQQPVYYDYGTGGNVTYENNIVYIGGEQVATQQEFAQTAAELATVDPPKSDDEAKAAEWMPLGTFTVASSQQDLDPSRTVQLAVSKTGVIAGTLYNAATDEAKSVQGQVDKETQRVALRIDGSEGIVIETGLYNLTQEEVPLLVHFGTDRNENWLLVRLENPDADAETSP